MRACEGGPDGKLERRTTSGEKDRTQSIDAGQVTREETNENKLKTLKGLPENTFKKHV